MVPLSLYELKAVIEENFREMKDLLEIDYTSGFQIYFHKIESHYFLLKNSVALDIQRKVIKSSVKKVIRTY